MAVHKLLARLKTHENLVLYGIHIPREGEDGGEVKKQNRRRSSRRMGEKRSEQKESKGKENGRVIVWF